MTVSSGIFVPTPCQVRISALSHAPWAAMFAQSACADWRCAACQLFKTMFATLSTLLSIDLVISIFKRFKHRREYTSNFL